MWETLVTVTVTVNILRGRAIRMPTMYILEPRPNRPARSGRPHGSKGGGAPTRDAPLVRCITRLSKLTSLTQTYGALGAGGKAAQL